MPKKFDTQDFIEKAKKVHNNFYDYSLVEYKNVNSKIKIICPIHGEFLQNARSHYRGAGCLKCSNKEKLTTISFIEKAKKVHGDYYDYSLVDYINCDTKVKIICPIHGEFLQKPSNHLSGRGCKKCYLEKPSSKRDTTISFIEKAKKVHGDYYDYSLVEYVKSNSKVKIICPKHGEFLQKPNNHLMGQNCPFCNKSIGEKKIRKILEEHNVNYVQEKTFSDCVDKARLRFDFYIPDKNLLIEFDGRQHFEPWDLNGGEKALLETKRRDEIKTRFALTKNIKLVRIRYDENIEEKLNEFEII